MVTFGDFAGWLIDVGDLDQASNMAREALSLGRDHVPWPLASPLVCLALLAALRGEMESAARFLGMFDEAWRNCGIDIPSHYLHRIDRATMIAREALGESAFNAARAQGPHAFTAILDGRLDEAIAPAETAESRPFAPGGADLTPRQRQVVALMVAGRSDRQIAEALFISHRTASHHVAAILEKLNARSRGEAAVRAVQAGLI